MKKSTVLGFLATLVTGVVVGYAMADKKPKEKKSKEGNGKTPVGAAAVVVLLLMLGLCFGANAQYTGLPCMSGNCGQPIVVNTTNYQAPMPTQYYGTMPVGFGTIPQFNGNVINTGQQYYSNGMPIGTASTPVFSNGQIFNTNGAIINTGQQFNSNNNSMCMDGYGNYVPCNLGNQQIFTGNGQVYNNGLNPNNFALNSNFGYNPNSANYGSWGNNQSQGYYNSNGYRYGQQFIDPTYAVFGENKKTTDTWQEYASNNTIRAQVPGQATERWQAKNNAYGFPVDEIRAASRSGAFMSNRPALDPNGSYNLGRNTYYNRGY